MCNIKFKMNYANAEIYGIHYLYVLASCNSTEARRLYQERYPDRRVPHQNVFTKDYGRMKLLKQKTADNGRPSRRDCPQSNSSQSDYKYQKYFLELKPTSHS